MKRFLLLCLLFAFASGLLFAQADEYPEDDVSGGFDYLRIRNGDQTIKVALGVNIPLLIQGGGMAARYPSNMNVGGVGALAYTYYIAGGFSVGGEINFQFNTTLAGNVLFKLPILLKAGYTFSVWRIHIPIAVGFGATFESYDGNNYFNISVQPEIAAYYLINEEWSIGVSVSYDFIPQWFDDSSYNRYGHFLNTCVSARYHF